MKKKIKITFWGVRGSTPTPGKRTIEIGGNTPCVAIEFNKEIIICDCGTGIRSLGESLKKKFPRGGLKATILPSHLHFDHLIGLPFFSPIYKEKNEFVFVGALGSNGLRSALTKLITPPYFPIPIRSVKSKCTFTALDKKPFKISEISVVPFLCNHPNGSWGWRFNFPNGKSIILVTDNEPKDARFTNALVKWMNGADILIHDAQYTPADYRKKRGWGHSPYSFPIELASKANIPKLYFYHYSPDYDDKKIQAILEAAKKSTTEMEDVPKIFLSYEGLTVHL